MIDQPGKRSRRAVKVPHPTMFVKLVEKICWKSAMAASTYVGTYVLGIPHSGYDGGNSPVGQTETECQLRQLFFLNSCRGDQSLNFPAHLLRAFSAKVRIAEVAVWKCDSRANCSGQAAFIKRNARNDANRMLLAIRQ
jgi:hypothetical protein